LLDLLLPDMDGFTICETIKLDRETNLIPIVMITASHRTNAPRIDRAASRITRPGGPSAAPARGQRVRRPAGGPDTVPDVATARVISVNTGRGRDAAWAGRVKRTAIDKRPAPGPVAVGSLGLAGDEQVDKPDHGGIR